MGFLLKYIPMLGVSLMPTVAVAQSGIPFEADEGGPLFRADVAGSRQLPDQEPVGLQAGSFVILPTLTARIAADSNVLRSKAAEKGDVFVVFQPAVQAKSQWGKDELIVRANAAVAKYATVSSQNSTTYGLAAAGRLDLGAKSTLTTKVSFDRLQERRGSVAESGVIGSPAEYKKIATQVSLNTETGNFRIRATAEASRLTYVPIDQGNGRVTNQDFRNADIFSGAIKTEYALPSAAIVFVEGRFDRLQSKKASICCDRSAWGGRVVGGIHADLGTLVTAELALGYAFRNYDSSAFKNYQGLAYGAKIDWYPTPLISARVSTGREIVSSGLPNAAGVISNATRLDIFYEFRRDINIGLNIGRTVDTYRDIGASASLFLIGMDARYAINSQVMAGVFGRYSERSADGSSLIQSFSGLEGGLWVRYSM